MSLPDFLRDLFEDGCTTVTGVEPVTDDDRAAAAEILAGFERRCRTEFPGGPPPLSLPAAVWAAEMLFNASRCLLYREIDEAGIDEFLDRPFVGERDASTHWSVDLSFALLPDLITRAEAASRDDPLVKTLRQWANEWPLSSVGVFGVEPEHLGGVISHPGLLRVYADRILVKNDLSRLNHHAVRTEIATALGAHPELAPEFSKHLQPPSSESETA